MQGIMDNLMDTMYYINKQIVIGLVLVYLKNIERNKK